MGSGSGVGVGCEMWNVNKKGARRKGVTRSEVAIAPSFLLFEHPSLSDKTFGSFCELAPFNPVIPCNRNEI